MAQQNFTETLPQASGPWTGKLPYSYTGMSQDLMEQYLRPVADYKVPVPTEFTNGNVIAFAVEAEYQMRNGTFGSPANQSLRPDTIKNTGKFRWDFSPGNDHSKIMLMKMNEMGIFDAAEKYGIIKLDRGNSAIVPSPNGPAPLFSDDRPAFESMNMTEVIAFVLGGAALGYGVNYYMNKKK